jgi:hypothetical protein
VCAMQWIVGGLEATRHGVEAWSRGMDTGRAESHCLRVWVIGYLPIWVCEEEKG